MLLFASVDGISKVGSFDGTGSDLDLDMGFTVKLFMVKRVDGTGHWYVFDTTRGLVSGNDNRLTFDSAEAHNTAHDLVDPITDGIRLHSSSGWFNDSSQKYIYYAHA